MIDMAATRCTLRLLAVTVAAATAVIGGGSVASAGPVTQSQDRENFTISDVDICGIPMDLTVSFFRNNVEKIASNGFPLFQSSGPSSTIFTNPASGKSVTATGAGASKDLSVADNGDGTITVTTQVTGIAERLIATSGGPALTMDVGRIVLATVLDYNGTKTNTDDDVFISQTVVSESGPHPEADSNFTIFCSVMVSAVT